MNVTWQLFSNASSDSAALKHLTRVQETCSFIPHEPLTEPYHKGGYKISFSTLVTATSWPEQVLEVLSIIQRLGRGWQLSGDIDTEVDVWSNETSVTGVQSAHVQCMKK